MPPPTLPTPYERSHSHGRGGAGNMASQPPSAPDAEKDFKTPTIKAPTYTTGRGGSGNMVTNDNPDNARRAQDVPENDRGRTSVETYNPQASVVAAANAESHEQPQIEGLASSSSDPSASAQQPRSAQQSRKPPASNVHGTFHWGRGGEGNMMTLGKSGTQESKEKPERRMSAVVEKGRELLGLKRNSGGGQSGSAAE